MGEALEQKTPFDVVLQIYLIFPSTPVFFSGWVCFLKKPWKTLTFFDRYLNFV